MLKLFSLFLCGLFSFFSFTQSTFAKKTWTGLGGDGLWMTAANWSGNTIPTTSDDIFLDNTIVSGSYTVTLDDDSVQTIHSLQIGYMGNSNLITLIIGGSINNILTLNGGGSTALHVTDGGILYNQSTCSSTTRGIKLSNSSDVFKMSGTGKYIHASSAAIPEMTSSTTSSNYDFATTSTFENQSGNATSFNLNPTYGNYCYNVNATKSVGKNLIITGNLSVLQGTLGVCASSSNTFLIGGDVSISSGATFRGSNGIGTATINISGNINGDGTLYGSDGSSSITNIIVAGNITSIIGFGSGTNSLTFSGGSATINFSPANSSEPTVQNVTIANGKKVSLGANIYSALGTTFTVENGGQLNLNNYVIRGTGTFTLESGGTLGIGSADGITLTSSKGSIQTSTRNYAADGNYVFNGSSAQVTGNGIVSANNLTIQNSTGVSLTSDLAVNNILTLSSGNLILGSKNLTLGTSASISGIPSASNMVVTDGTGELRKIFSGIGSFTFPIGENTGTIEYSPVTLNFTSGTFSDAYAGAICVNTKHSNNSSTSDYIKRYWKLTQNGISSFSCNVSFQYNHADIIGDENNLYCGHWDGTNWTLLNEVDAANNILSGTVTSFSEFSGGNSSALPIELISFNAVTKDDNIFLTWQTATEVNNYGFNIERKALTDGLNNLNNWVTIGFANGSGNSNSPRNYFFMDKNIPSGKYSYRLKQIDNNGSSKYLKEIEVEQNRPLTFLLNQNYPNPFNPSTTISFTIPADGQVNLILYNVIGQKIRSLINDYRKAGSYEIKFSANELCNGTYFYKLSAGNFSEVKKMILLK